jgi:hypothetical protein
MSQEVENVDSGDLDRVLADRGEEGRQVERHRSQAQGLA